MKETKHDAPSKQLQHSTWQNRQQHNTNATHKLWLTSYKHTSTPRTYQNHNDKQKRNDMQKRNITLHYNAKTTQPIEIGVLTTMMLNDMRNSTQSPRHVITNVNNTTTVPAYHPGYTLVRIK
jgi:hypothetical protein